MLGVVTIAAGASAFPSSVVFAPTGEAKDLGTVSHFGYAAMSLKPQVRPGVSWVGNQVGLLPRIKYGGSGLTFGGVEVGVDAFNADYLGQPNAYVKPLVNGKLQLLMETGWVPAFAVGYIGAPFRMERSQNLFYGSVTKSLSVGGAKLGRLTLGFGHCENDDRTVFYATAPFAKAASFLLLGGYESPSLGPLSIAIDQIGGVGEINSTNAAINLTPFDGATVSGGAFFSNDRSTEQARIDGAMAFVTIQWNVITAFAGKPSPAPAKAFTPSPNPDPPLPAPVTAPNPPPPG